MLSTEDDPERQKHGVEYALANVSEQKHPRPVEAHGEPLYRDVDEGHRDTESKDHPVERK